MSYSKAQKGQTRKFMVGFFHRRDNIEDLEDYLDTTIADIDEAFELAEETFGNDFDCVTEVKR